METKKYLGVLYLKDIGYRNLFLVSEDKKEWFDNIVLKYGDEEIVFPSSLNIDHRITIDDLSDSIDWKEMVGEIDISIEERLCNSFPFEKHLENYDVKLSNNDINIINVWKEVDGKILKLEKDTQSKVLSLFIKLEYELDIDDEDDFIKSSEYKGSFIEDGYKSIEMCYQYPYLWELEAEECDSSDIITYEDLKNICIENNII